MEMFMNRNISQSSALWQLLTDTSELLQAYLPSFRGDMPSSFTRNRKLPVERIHQIMIDSRNCTRYAEPMNFYERHSLEDPPSDTALYQARMKLNPEPLNLINIDLMGSLYEQQQDVLKKWKGFFLFSVDGSDVIVPSSEENARIFGRSRNSADPEKNPCMAKLSVIMDSLNGFILDTQFERYKFCEGKLALRHLKVLSDFFPYPAIVLADRGYFSYGLLLELTKRKLKFVLRIDRNTLKSEQEMLRDQNDVSFTLRLTRARTNEYRTDPVLQDELMNAEFPLRLLKIPLAGADGQETYEVLLTNLSQEEAAAEECGELYHLRWPVEGTYDILKNKMDLENFSSKKERLIRQDVYVSVYVYNAVQAAVLDTNNQIHQKQKYEMAVNTNNAIGVIKTYYVRAILEPDLEKKKKLIEKIQALVLKRLVPIRPGRKNPRSPHPNRPKYRGTRKRAY